VAASNKFFTSNLLQALSECAIEILGPQALLYDQPGTVQHLADATPGYKYLYNRCLTIAGGTSEVQRNIVAQRILGLPRDRGSNTGK
jgi:alkylation response protein AidB-like acyl-CoA dehydrogenase